VKTLAAEHPGVAARTVELPPGAGAAEILHGELHASDPHVEVVYRGGGRSILEVVPAELPAPSGAPPLDADSVVLVTGGARGITAKVAVALARRYGCRVELVRRSARRAMRGRCARCSASSCRRRPRSSSSARACSPTARSARRWRRSRRSATAWATTPSTCARPRSAR
jgi:hypothetical protein